MSIKIIKPGMAATLQGAVRSGYRSMGIGSSGAMDNFAMKAANYLTGNESSAAVIEINFPAPEIMFFQNALISVTGANFGAAINDSAVPGWTLLFVKKNSILQFKKRVSGARAYIAVQGGWQATEWLNSYSTHLKAAAGGYSGRILQKDDVIEFTATDLSFDENKIYPWHISEIELNKIYQPPSNIRCIHGIEWDLLDDVSKINFEKNDFIISEQSDRMGYRLNSAALLLQQQTELISSATDTGIVQLLPEGNCIILMADHQTTGGYPRIASVIKADLPKLAQAVPLSKINFACVSLQEAENTFTQMQKALREIKNACYFNLKKANC
jgi:antagonist of KipI